MGREISTGLKWKDFCFRFYTEVSSREVVDGEAVGGQLRLNEREGRLERVIGSWTVCARVRIVHSRMKDAAGRKPGTHE